MKKVLFKLFGISLFCTSIVSAAFAAEAKIEAFKAPFYVGQSVMACGNLVETKHLSNRHYLNLDRKYPNQTLTILVWRTITVGLKNVLVKLMPKLVKDFVVGG